MNDRSEFDNLKARIDLAALIGQSVELKRVGKNLMGRCPIHDDSTASLSVNGQLWKCFGCDARGDVVEWIRLKEKLEFPQVKARMLELAQQLPDAPAKKSKPELEPMPAGLNRSELLAQVMEHYRKCFRESKEAQGYLVARGLASKEAWDGFRVGFADGTLMNTLPQTGAVREALTEIGIINAKGREHFRGCVVIPLDHPDLNTVGMYGRRIGADSQITHLYLPGPKKGVLNWQSLKLSPKIWLAESVLDAISLWIAGVRDVTCLYGVSGLPADLDALMTRYGTKEVVLCLDGDRAGREAVSRLGTILTGKHLKCWDVRLPEGRDVNDLLVSEGPKPLKLLAHKQQALDLAPPAPENESYVRTADGFCLQFGDLNYKLTPQPPFGSRLRVTLRATRGSRLYLDTIDLYSNRYRNTAALQLGKRLDVPRGEAEMHLMTMLDRAEEWAAEALANAASENGEEKPKIEMTAAEREEALEFLESPDLIARLLQDTETLGFVGEENGKLLTYLIGVSRKLDRPLSGIIRSQSGAGKSSLTQLVVMLTPPEDVREYSRLSPQALSFMPKDHLSHTLLNIDERAGSEAADYQIRTLQSSHKLSQAVVVKDPVTGKLHTRFFEVLGPIAYLETTTNHQLNPENASRCFEIHMDESEEQTLRVHQSQRQLRERRPNDRKLQMEEVIRRHHNAQRMLERVIVFIPYVNHLKFPSRWLRTRRDNERFLCLIEAVTFWHQYQREQGHTVEGTRYILSTSEDYRIAFTLAQAVLLNSLHELSREGQELLESIRSYVEEVGDPQEVIFTRKDLRQYTNIQDHRIRVALNELVDMEYLSVASGSNGKAFHYRLLGTGPSVASPLGFLTTPDQLEAILAAEAEQS